MRSFSLPAVLLLTAATALRAQPLTTGFTYQGELRSSGTPASGLFDFRFRLYDASTGGAQQGPTLCSDNITLTAGRFTTQLDFGSVFSGAQRFLEIDARQDTGTDCSISAGFTTLGPRQPLTAAPYASFSTAANTAQSAVNASALNSQPASFYTNAANLSAGTIPTARLAGTYSSALTLSSTSNIFAGSGAGLTGLDAANIATGTLADTRLSADIPRLDAVNTFTGSTNSFAGRLGIGTTAPFSVVEIVGDGGGSSFPLDALRVEGLNGAGVSLNGGDSTASNMFSGAMTLVAGSGFSNPSGNGSNGAPVGIAAGQGGGASGSGAFAGVGGNIFLTTGSPGFASSGATPGRVGSIFIRTRTPFAAATPGGVRIEQWNGGFNSSDTARATLEVNGGYQDFPVLSVSGSNGSPINLHAGNSPSTAGGSAGPVTISAGSGVFLSTTGNRNGAPLTLAAGAGTDTFISGNAGNGGDIILRCGVGGAGTPAGIPGGVAIAATDFNPNPQALLHVFGDVRADAQIAWTNPALSAARGVLDWNASTARIQIGGSGTGSANGLDIQGSAQTSLLRVLDSGNIGIGTTAPAARLHIQGPAGLADVILAPTSNNGNSQILLAENPTLTGGFFVRYNGASNLLEFDATINNVETTPRMTIARSTTGGVAIANNLSVGGNVAITGTISKGGGSFKIDHPLDPENKYLYHSFVESPDMMNIYNGNATTDGAGHATITLPDWFEALNKNFRYQLTVIDAADNLPDFVTARVIRKVQNNQFTIRTSLPNVEVSWQVTGIRKDAFAEHNRIPVEQDKSPADRGRYLHPAAFGLPADRSMFANPAPRPAPAE
jgi:hypothetical protein